MSKPMPVDGFCWVMPKADGSPWLVLGGTFAADSQASDAKMVRWADDVSTMDYIEGNREMFMGYPMMDQPATFKLSWLTGKGYHRIRAQIVARERIET